MKLFLKQSRNDIFKIIGANVKRYRLLHNANNPNDKITQKELAKNCKVSTGLIGSLESGKVAGISIPVLWNISQVLNVSIEKLFEENNYK